MNTNNKFSIIFIILSILGIAILIQVFHRPLQRLTSDFYHPFFSPISKVENLTAKQALLLESKTTLVDELLHMQQINERTSAELNILQKVEEENNYLKEILPLKPSTGFKCVYAEIYLRDPAKWNESFSINKGFADGIKPGCVVLCRIPKEKGSKYVFAVAGRVSQVTQNESQIETVISRNCQISVLLKDTKTAGILQGGTYGNGAPSIKVTKLPAFKTYKKDEIVVTSGLSKDTTPPLLYIGNIATHNNKPDIRIINNLYAEGTIIPAVNFDNLRYLIVLIPKPKKRIKTE
jgi:rod shape-determining protein MreC